MTALAPHICGPCSRGECHQCRPEWACSCNHVRGLTPVPDPAPAPAVPANSSTACRAEAEAASGAAGAWGSASVAPTPPQPGPDIPPSGPGAPSSHTSAGRLFPGPGFWGENGCRFADRSDHVCRSSFGMALQPGQACFSESRASMRELMDSYRAVGL